MWELSSFCSPTAKSFTWKGAINPYIKSYAFWKCPSNPNNNVPSEDIDKNIMTSYAVNGIIFHGHRNSDRTPPRNLASFAEPASTMTLLESTWTCPDLGDWVGDDGCKDRIKPFQKHGDILNWAFVDGHVKAMKYSALWAPGTVPPYHDMWGAWEDSGNGQPDRGQVTKGTRAITNMKTMCPYLR